MMRYLSYIGLVLRVLFVRRLVETLFPFLSPSSSCFTICAHYFFFSLLAEIAAWPSAGKTQPRKTLEFKHIFPPLRDSPLGVFVDATWMNVVMEKYHDMHIKRSIRFITKKTPIWFDDSPSAPMSSLKSLSFSFNSHLSLARAISFYNITQIHRYSGEGLRVGRARECAKRRNKRLK